MEFRYEEFVRHNSPLLTSEDQEKLRNIRLLIAGCGTGSVLAEALVRMGFEQLILADGDTVELGNINRQAYELRDIGAKKVEALAKRLKKINPQCNLTAVPEFLNAENVSAILEMADIVVDFIDVVAVDDILALHREARKQGKSIVAPLGAGWGAALTIFTPNSISIEEMFKSYTGAEITELSNNDLSEMFQRFQIRAPAIPAYISRSISDLLRLGGIREMVAGVAQPAIAALTASDLSAAAVVRLALGLPTKVAPNVIHFDPWLAIDPSD